MSVGIIFICYALHTKYKPFLPPNNDMLDNEAALTSGMALVYVSVSTNTLQRVHQCAPACPPTRSSVPTNALQCVLQRAPASPPMRSSVLFMNNAALPRIGTPPLGPPKERDQVAAQCLDFEQIHR